MDRKNTSWFVATLILSAASIGLYVWDAPRHDGKWGSTWCGLAMGVAALAVMVFLVGLGLKRRVPHWRLGRAQTWLRGHIWLGVLLVVLVALHAAFAIGGTLTLWMWILLALITVSGIFGVLLQQFIPSLLLHNVPGETVAQQLDRQIAALPDLAERVLKNQTNDAIVRFHREHMQPYFVGSTSRLGRGAGSETLFQSLRIMTPTDTHGDVNQLEELCRHRRQLLHQKRMMRLMFSWLIVHVPLSWTLLIMTIAHAVIALRFG
jgi:hypothetical protein